MVTMSVFKMAGNIFICVPIGVILYIALEVLYLFIFILRALKKTIKNDKT